MMQSNGNLGEFWKSSKITVLVVWCKIYFEIRCKHIVSTIKQLRIDLPGVLVTSWRAWIQFFVFDSQHISGQKQSVTDKLSQRSLTTTDLAETENKEDIDDFILAEPNYFRVSPIF